MVTVQFGCHGIQLFWLAVNQVAAMTVSKDGGRISTSSHFFTNEPKYADTGLPSGSHDVLMSLPRSQLAGYKVSFQSILEPISCIRRLTSGRQRYSLWGQTPLFLGFCWRRRISVSDFLLFVPLAVYSPTVYSPT